jgi:transcriptional regulator with XRE-family HTH domain
LKEEREALGLSQQALADACGISARSQRNYESGERSPDAAYLAAIAALGADVLFVLTGQRSQPVPATATLRPDQAALLDNYEHSDEVARQAAHRLLDPSSQRKKA